MQKYQPRTRFVEAEQLTTDNADNLVTLLPDGIRTDDGVQFTVFGDTVQAAYGDYIMRNDDGYYGAWPAADFEHDYRLTANPTDRELIDALTTRVAALEGN